MCPRGRRRGQGRPRGLHLLGQWHSRSQSASGRQSQQTNNLTSTGTLLKTATANRRQLGNSRLAKSATNLTDISALSKFEKSPNRRTSTSTTRSRNSSTSDTSLSDTRSAKLKPKKTTEPSPTKTPRNLANNKTRPSPPKEDVFSRLSRPKSTPPVTRQTMATPTFQSDLLLVQRNKKGSHKIQRSTIAGTSPRQQQFNRTKTMPPEKKETKTLNSAKKPLTTITPRTSRTERQTPASKTPRATGRQTVTGREARPRPLSARLSKSSSFDLDLSPKTPPGPSHSRIIDEKEKEKLEAFEKECISNKITLQMKENNQRRKSSSDSSSEMQRQLSRSSAEDNEVAMHMQQMPEKSSRPVHPPSAFSMPKPRKDKVNSHEHPTRIPTPISFSRPLLQHKEPENASLKMQKAVDILDPTLLRNARSIVLNEQNGDISAEDKSPQQKNARASSFNKVLQNGNDVRGDVIKKYSANSAEAIKNKIELSRRKTTEKVENHKNEPKMGAANGATGDYLAYAHPELRQPRLNISVEQINRLLNTNRVNVEKLQSKPKPARGILTEYPESGSENHSLATSNQVPSAFVRVDNRSNGSTKPVTPNSPHHIYVSSRQHPPTSYPGRNKPSKDSISVDLNDNVAGYHGDKPDFSAFFQQSSLKNALIESKFKQNGIQFNQASPDNTKVYWV